jgi:hypothetical protein
VGFALAAGVIALSVWQYGEVDFGSLVMAALAIAYGISRDCVSIVAMVYPK